MNYKEFKKISIGGSDIGALTLTGIMNYELDAKILNFGGDGSYKAYLVDHSSDEEVEIGSHYHQVYSFTHWLKIYDDFDRVFSVYAKAINVYRAGDYGCIIEVIDRR